MTLMYCTRYAAEAVLRDEIQELQRLYGDEGRFVVRYYLSRETADANGMAGGIEGAVCGRHRPLSRALNFPEAFLAVQFFQFLLVPAVMAILLHVDAG